MDEIARLRSLLGIAEDRDAVDEIGERVVDPELRAQDIAEVLPDAVTRAEREGRLTPSLEGPIEHTLRKSITRDPKGFADILFPVMGPAIRRSITDTLRAALEGLNRALELGLSARGLRWRLESWRTGVPFREVVLRHTMAYRVREAFLISRDSGLLMVRAGEPGSEALDRDAVAAMLTAIEDFVADSTGGGDEELASAELGGHVLWVIPGPKARLALVVEGQPPRSVKFQLQEVLERIHGGFGTWLAAYDGSQPPQPELVEEVASCLGWETLDSDEDADGKKRRLGPATIVLSLVALGLLLWGVWSAVENRQEAARWDRLQALLAEQPGLVYVGSRREDDVRQVRVLADPAAADPEGLARAAGFEAGSIRWSIHPYLSVEPEMVARRLRQALAPIPDGIAIEVAGAVTIRGVAPAEWIERLHQYLRFQAHPESIRIGTLTEDFSELLARVRAALAPPEGIAIGPQADGGIAVSGLAGERWRAQAEATLARDFDGVEVDWSGYRDARAQLASHARTLRERAVYFGPGDSSGTGLDAGAIVASLEQIGALVPHCDCLAELTVVGCSDASGSQSLNRSLRRARAQWLLGELKAHDPAVANTLALDAECTGVGDEARSAYVKLALRDR